MLMPNKSGAHLEHMLQLPQAVTGGVRHAARCSGLHVTEIAKALLHVQCAA